MVSKSHPFNFHWFLSTCDLLCDKVTLDAFNKHVHDNDDHVYGHQECHTQYKISVLDFLQIGIKKKAAFIRGGGACIP